MPDIPGRLKGKHGFISPAPPHGAPKEVREFMAKTYDGLRAEKFPGEHNKRNKERAARLTWYLTKKEYGKKSPELFRKSHTKDPPAESSHSESYGRIIQTPDIHVPADVPAAKTKTGRKCQVRDLRAAAQEQRAWAGQAEREGVVESKRGKEFKKHGMPIRGKVLADDAKLAKGFAKDRRTVASDLDIQAARISAIEGE